MAMSAADQELMELQRSASVQGHAAGIPTGADAGNPAMVPTWEARRRAQREAYGQFVAAGPIHIGNCLAFHKGQQVPLEHVITYRLEEQELVHRVATPEMARDGKAFASEAEFHAANPHFRRRATSLPEAHPAALDPRGAAAGLDTDGRHVASDSEVKSAAKPAPRSAVKEA